MQALNYFPHISRPTRFPDNPRLGQPSLLDHIWTNYTPLSISGIIRHPISDHLPIFLNISLMSNLSAKHKITFRISNIATTMYKKQINVSLPPHEYTTRQRQCLCIPAHRLSIFRHSTSHLGPTIWDSLPLQYKNVHSIHKFKSKLKNHFRDAY